MISPQSKKSRLSKAMNEDIKKISEFNLNEKKYSNNENNTNRRISFYL